MLLIDVLLHLIQFLVILHSLPRLSLVSLDLLRTPTCIHFLRIIACPTSIEIIFFNSFDRFV